MRKGFRRILFAIRDVEAVTPGALRKIGALARGSGARLELYHALTETIVVPRSRGLLSGPSVIDDVFETVARKSVRRLDRLVRSAALRDLRVTAHVDWDYPAHEAIVRRAVATKADLVVGEAHHHPRAARAFLQNTDWELIRQCPVPLLLLKSSRRYVKPSVLVAVDPFHAADKPATLDKALLAAGARLSAGLGGTLHAVHAWLPLAALVPTAASAPVPVWLPPEAEAAHEKRIRKAFEALTRRAGVKPAGRHLVAGSIHAALESVARQSRAAIVVMGAISRRGLKRLFIGSTAERMLDQLDCDVLIVKPPGFRTRIAQRATPRPPVIGPLPY
jgi:universal stress protein E